MTNTRTLQAHDQLGDILTMLKGAFPDETALTARPEAGRAREISVNREFSVNCEVADKGGRFGDVDALASSRSVLVPSLLTSRLPLTVLVSKQNLQCKITIHLR